MYMKTLLLILFTLFPVSMFGQIDITVCQGKTTTNKYLKVTLVNTSSNDVLIKQDEMVIDRFSYVHIHQYMNDKYLGTSKVSYITDEIRNNSKTDFKIKAGCSEDFIFNLDSLLYNSPQKKTTRIKVRCVLVGFIFNVENKRVEYLAKNKTAEFLLK